MFCHARDMQDPLPHDLEQNTALSLNEEVNLLFADPGARRSIVGLFDLLLKIDRRINPHNHENHD